MRADSLLYVHCVIVQQGALLWSTCHLSVSVWKGRELPQQSHSALTGLCHVTHPWPCGGRRVRERPPQDKQRCVCCFFVLSLCVSPPPPSHRHVGCSSSLLFPPSDAASSGVTHQLILTGCVWRVCVCCLNASLDRECVCV